jgi:hypothetical protein
MQSVAQDPMTSTATTTTSWKRAPPHVLRNRELEEEVQELSMYRMMYQQQTRKTRNLQKGFLNMIIKWNVTNDKQII